MTTDAKQLVDPAVTQATVPTGRQSVAWGGRSPQRGRPGARHALLGTLTSSATVLLAVFITTLAPVCRADDKDEQQRTRLLEQMRALAEGTQVRFENGDRQPELVPRPVFRYDDQPRRFIDATMWVWTDGGRPVAFEKVEAMIFTGTSQPRWQYCFTSLASEPLAVEWANGRKFGSTEPGVEYLPLAGAPPVSPRDNQRRRDVRRLGDAFSSRVLNDPVNDRSEEMRLLPTPVFEYTDPETSLFQGAVFGFASSGRNPTLLLVLEARGDPATAQWHFAAARMTNGGLTLKYEGKTVWEAPLVHGHEATFATWTFYHTPRIDALVEPRPTVPSTEEKP